MVQRRKRFRRLPEPEMLNTEFVPGHPEIRADGHRAVEQLDGVLGVAAAGCACRLLIKGEGFFRDNGDGAESLWRGRFSLQFDAQRDDLRRRIVLAPARRFKKFY